MMRTRLSPSRLFLMTIAAALVVAGAVGLYYGRTGGMRTAPSPSPSANVNAIRQQFVACLRQHGYDAPDDFLPRGKGQVSQIPQAAWIACDPILGQLPQPTVPPLGASSRQRLEKYQTCMRGKGFPVTIKFEAGGFEVDGSNPSHPGFNAADRACMPPNGVYGGSGPQP